MGRWLTVGMLVATACAATACAATPDPSERTPLRAVIEDPEAYAGERVVVTAAYYSSFEVSVLATGFAESNPPQPVEPLVWVDAVPPQECTERTRDVTWAHSLVAVGTFQYDPDAGFGHLGAYDMALQDATLTCA
jgi:hypothetical protein